MTNRSEYALELWISTELMPKNQFYQAKMKIFKKCIPLACESVPENVRLFSKPCDLRGPALGWGGGLSNALTNLCMALYCPENSVQNYKKKIVEVLDKYWGEWGGGVCMSLV